MGFRVGAGVIFDEISWAEIEAINTTECVTKATCRKLHEKNFDTESR